MTIYIGDPIGFAGVQMCFEHAKLRRTLKHTYARLFSINQCDPYIFQYQHQSPYLRFALNIRQSPESYACQHSHDTIAACGPRCCILRLIPILICLKILPLSCIPGTLANVKGSSLHSSALSHVQNNCLVSLCVMEEACHCGPYSSLAAYYPLLLFVMR